MDWTKFGANSISDEIVELEGVTTEDLIPINTDKTLTAWKFKFCDVVLWIPSTSISNVLDYAIVFKMLINAGMMDFSAEYEVFGDSIGMISKVLNPNQVAFSDSNECIEKNIESSDSSYANVPPTKKIGIYFNDSLNNIIDDCDYDRVYTISRGDIVQVLMYMFLSQMQFSSKTSNYCIDKVIRCNDFVLFRYKRILNNADHGPKELTTE